MPRCFGISFGLLSPSKTRLYEECDMPFCCRVTVVDDSRFWFDRSQFLRNQFEVDKKRHFIVIKWPTEYPQTTCRTGSRRDMKGKSDQFNGQSDKISIGKRFPCTPKGVSQQVPGLSSECARVCVRASV